MTVGQLSVDLLGVTAHFAAEGRVLLPGPLRHDLAQHQAHYGTGPTLRAGHDPALLGMIEASGLTGRGGASFPVAAKWRAALASPAPRLAVANGAESEPLSAKDAALLQLRPHLVLDGLACTAQALGAASAIVWLNERAQGSYQAITEAIAERRAAGVDDVAIQVSWGPDSYLSGESSAIVRGLEGAPARPAFTRHPAARHGVHGQPTVIHNAETLARIGLIAHHGPGAAALGRLVTVVSGEVSGGVKGGVLSVREVPASATVGQTVRPVIAAWMNGQEPQAILVGGYGGSWARWADVAELSLDQLDGHTATPSGLGRRSAPTRRELRQASPAPSRRQLRDASSAPSRRPALTTGILAAIPPESCGIAETAAVAEYLARSSARQCGPCQFGTRALADTLAKIANGSGRRSDADRLRRTAGEVDGRGACGMPDGAVSLTRTALTVFAADVEQHTRRRGCAHVAGHTVLHVPEAPE